MKNDIGDDNLIKELMQEWILERNVVIRSLDVEKFKAFWKKWSARGFYRNGLPLPDDEVIEISLYKMLYNLESATEEEKNKAKEWLESRGFDVFLM
ncbi:MAG: hypothetical protein VZQ98_09540 [Bacteroidales bacterium]|nr:hypothetical protein [Bacteroidales bacterium]